MRRLLSCIAPLVLLLLAQPAQAASATLEGVVVDQATGTPLAGARVKLFKSNDEEPLYTKTDTQGRFAFTSLASERHFIRAEQPGYMMPGDSPYGSGRSAWIDLTLPAPNQSSSGAGCPMCGPKVDKKVDSAGVLHGEVTLELVPYGVITGKVTDPDGRPLSRLRIELLMKKPIPPGAVIQPGQQQLLPDGQSMASPAGRFCQSDDRGEFRLALLEAGTYYLRASSVQSAGQWAAGYRTTYYSGALDLGSAKPIQVGVGRKVRTDVQIIRQAGVRVAGRLSVPGGVSTSADARMLTRVDLVAEEGRRRDPNSGGAVVRGQEYEFKDVLPGKYLLRATSYEREGGVRYGGGRKPLYGVLRVVEIGSIDVSGLDLALQSLPDIHGVVTFAEGCAPVAVKVQATSSLGWSIQPSATVDAPDGTFALSRVEPGPARLNASSFLPSAPTYWVVSMTLDGRDIRYREFDAPLPDGAVVRITMGCPGGRNAR